MTGLALSLLLVVPVSELTPPPLVDVPPAEPEPVQLAPQASAPAQPQLQSDGGETYGNASQRIFVTALTAAAGSAVTFGVSVWLSNQIGSTGTSPLLIILSVPLTLMVAGATATGVHRKLDGQGSLWSHIGGMAIGAAVGLGIWAFTTGFRFSSDTPTTIGIGTAAALLAGMGAALMGELSHWRWWNENHPSVALVPTRGGASASFGWSF